MVHLSLPTGFAAVYGSCLKDHLFPDGFAGSAKWFHLPAQPVSAGDAIVEGAQERNRRLLEQLSEAEFDTLAGAGRSAHGDRRRDAQEREELAQISQQYLDMLDGF